MIMLESFPKFSNPACMTTVVFWVKQGFALFLYINLCFFNKLWKLQTIIIQLSKLSILITLFVRLKVLKAFWFLRIVLGTSEILFVTAHIPFVFPRCNLLSYLSGYFDIVNIVIKVFRCILVFIQGFDISYLSIFFFLLSGFLYQCLLNKFCNSHVKHTPLIAQPTD